MAIKHPDTESPAQSTGKGRPTICVFCGSSPGHDPAFLGAARQFGTLVGENGFGFLFGGGRLGLMGAAAVAAHDAGAEVIGIMPAFLRHLEPPLKGELEQVVIVPDLFTRKQEMIARSDAFAVLPGGFGTLDEFLEVVSAAQLGVHAKPVVVLNTMGFFDPVLAALRHVAAHGFVQAEALALFDVASTPEEAIAFLAEKLGRRTLAPDNRP